MVVETLLVVELLLLHVVESLVVELLLLVESIHVVTVRDLVSSTTKASSTLHVVVSSIVPDLRLLLLEVVELDSSSWSCGRSHSVHVSSAGEWTHAHAYKIFIERGKLFC